MTTEFTIPTLANFMTKECHRGQCPFDNQYCVIGHYCNKCEKVKQENWIFILNKRNDLYKDCNTLLNQRGIDNYMMSLHFENLLQKMFPELEISVYTCIDNKFSIYVGPNHLYHFVISNSTSEFNEVVKKIEEIINNEDN